jgi:hypothetical protein
MTIQLERDEAGKLRLHVGLRSDTDEPPSEHERQHRRLLGQLLPALAGCDEPGDVKLERERPAREPVVG